MAGDDFSADLSMERVALIDGDLVVLARQRPRRPTCPSSRPRSSTRRLDVHQRAATCSSAMFEPEGAATTFITPLSIPFLLDGLVPAAGRRRRRRPRDHLIHR